MSGIKRYLSDNAYKAAEHSESPGESNPFVTLHKAIAMRSDWDQSNSSADNYIKNKPAIKAGLGNNSIIEGDIDNNVAEGLYAHAEGSSATASGNFSHAEGSSTTATGGQSHAEGTRTTASGVSSHAEGRDTTASGFYSHAEGCQTQASGSASHAEGLYTQATMDEAHAEGYETTASGSYSHAEGANTTAKNRSQHAFGEFNELDPSTASPWDRGTYVEIVGNGADENTRSNARTLDWDGNETLAGNLTIGGTITANGQQILPQKQVDWNQTTSTESDYIKNKPTIEPQVQVDWNQSDPESPDFVKNRPFYEDITGELVLTDTPVGGVMYFDWGEIVPVVGKSYSIESDTDNDGNGILEHQITTGIGQAWTNISPNGVAIGVSGVGSLNYTPTNFSAEGHNVNGKFSGNPNMRFLRLLDTALQKIDAKFIDGSMTSGTGLNSNKFNSVDTNVASGEYSHAEGYDTTASGNYSHAEGYDTTASGNYGSHAEGHQTTASGGASHAEGSGTTASGASSHAEGSGTTSGGASSHAEGYYTTANHRSQHVFGEHNIVDPSLNAPDDRGNYIEIVGNGATSSAKSNARTLDWSGNETLAGNLTIGGAITANGQQILPQKQSDWNQTTSAESDYIKNKPTKLSDFINDGEGDSPLNPFTTTEDVTNSISAHNSDITTHEDIRLSVASQGGRISAVEELIPAQATSSNNLADKEFVNSSISTNTANFKGTYNTLAELEATTADNNDYGFVVTTDASGNTVYNRYKYSGASWSYEYSLNNSAFTAAQWEAIQSGITSDSVAKLNGVVHDACKIQSDGFTKSSGTLAGSLNIWNTPRAAGYYSSPDSVVQIFYPDVKTANGTAAANSSGVIDISGQVTGEINSAVGSAVGSLTGEVYTTFKKLYPQISTSTELSATTFNSIGVLTKSITFTLPTIAVGTAPEFNGQFTVDSSAAYSVTFPAGIVMQGDTIIEAGGTYQFSICNGYGIIIKVN